MDKMYNIDDANSCKIKEIAEFFLESWLSLWNFCNLYCLFSHVTLREKFLNVLPFVDKEMAEKVKEKLESKRAKNINDDYEAKIRTLSAIKMLMERNLTVKEIAEELNTTEMIIYRDLTKRALIMEEIDSNLKRQILLRLQDHKNYNLTKGRW